MGALEFGSPEWFAAAQAAISELDVGTAELTLEQQIGQQDDLRYRLEFANSRVSIGLVPAEVSADPAAGEAAPSADVTLVQSAETAAAIRSGQLGALEAIQSGQIKVRGDVTKLLAAADAIATVDEALQSLAN